MADNKSDAARSDVKTTEVKAASRDAATPAYRANEPDGELTPVSVTADPVVQQLLTERQTANNSGDSIRVNQLNEQLRQMGYDVDK